jgi:hypothetical protein
MNITARPRWLPGDSGQWGRAEPLWKLVPRRDEEGRLCTDFMMLAPGFKKKPAHERECVIGLVQGVLSCFDQWVIFADLNLTLNVLWVSLKYRPGIMAEVVAALRTQAPEFKLVAHNPNR